MIVLSRELCWGTSRENWIKYIDNTYYLPAFQILALYTYTDTYLYRCVVPTTYLITQKYI